MSVRSESDKKVFGIFYGDREYAKSQGDPLLARVEASSKEEAESKANTISNIAPGAGVWAIEFHKCCYSKCPGYIYRASEFKHTGCVSK